MGKYVALLDILGFKDIINNNPHEEVVELFDQFRIYLQSALAKNKSKKDSRGRLVFDVTNSTLNSNIISDSLIFWTNDSKTSSLFELIECIHDLTDFCHNLPKIFLRGGITYGDFFYHNNGVIRGDGETLIIHPIMVGKALVDVYEIEKNIQMAGCIITEEAINAAKEDINEFNQKWEKLILHKKIVNYNVPTKNTNINYWTVNWIRNKDENNLEEILEGFTSFNKKTNDPLVEIKILNTTNYFNFIQEQIYKRKK